MSGKTNGTLDNFNTVEILKMLRAKIKKETEKSMSPSPRIYDMKQIELETMGRTIMSLGIDNLGTDSKKRQSGKI